MRAITLTAAILMVPAQGFSAELTKGGDISGLCGASVLGSAADQTCNIYVNGVIAGMLADQVDTESGYPVCLPTQTTTDQIRAAIVQFMRTFPEFSQMDASAVVAVALSRTFPCKKSN